MATWRSALSILILGLAACAGEPATDGTTDGTEPADAGTDATAEPAPAPRPKKELAISGEAMEVTLPTGKTTTADKVATPAEGTIEHSIQQSLTLITAGEFDTWITEWCAPSLCNDDKAVDSLKRFNLPATQKTGGQCLWDDGVAVVVTRRDEPEGGEQRVYIHCQDGRMPPPSSHVKVGERYKVTSFSW